MLIELDKVAQAPHPEQLSERTTSSTLRRRSRLTTLTCGPPSSFERLPADQQDLTEIRPNRADDDGRKKIDQCDRERAG